MAYDERHGDPDAVDYYKWSSYSSTEKTAVVSLFVWWGVNLTAICYILYRLVNRWRSVKAQPRSTF